VPLEFVIAVAIDEPLLIKLIVLLGSAIPSIVGVELFVRVVVVVIDGVLVTVSTVIFNIPDADEVLPDKSVALTKRL
jgi:hypothetical protein